MDPKARLQHCLNEFAAETGIEMKKKFELMEESGPSHDRMYKVGCYINEVCIWDAHLGVGASALESFPAPPPPNTHTYINPQLPRRHRALFC